MRRHVAVAGVIVLACAALYAHVSGAWFCGYDDFNESYRAAFFDAVVPSRILTATHFTNFMYRPVTSALQLATWDAGHAALAFRIRNLSMHLVSVVLVYGIAVLIGRSVAAAAAAATLFAFNPFANEAVVVAIWTNTTAYALAFGSFFLFLLALRASSAASRPWIVLLVASLALALLAMFTYEPTIVVLAIEIVYLALCCRPPATRDFVVAFGVGFALDAALFFGTRAAIHVTAAPQLPPGTIARNLLEYLAAVALPIDPVLANRLFGVPLPSSASAFAAASLLPAAIGALVLVIVFLLGLAKPIRTRLVSAPWRTIAFLMLSIPISLAPIVAYRDHVSEFNLYVPAAFSAIVVSLVVAHFSRDRLAFAAVVGLLTCSYAAGVVVRNDRVIACAHVASAIVAGLPLQTWREGTWPVRLATPSDETLTPRYGIYNYAGIETLEVTETKIRGAEEALRLATGNERLTVDVVPSNDLAHGCTTAKTCYYVFPNGNVEEVVPDRERSSRKPG